ncbi:hypothetical protein [Clostridium sp.]|uniref:hypothetical protein n=1 Tax=Clostridium sp. TaxID=1506 RepID=UPI00261E0836|nr:hypothetical protein [Clostridium sp.]
MIANKIKVPQASLLYKYNEKYDILDVYIDKIVPVISDEIYTGVYDYFDENTEELVGISIMDYTTRNKEFLKNILPFDINFNYIQSNIMKA